MITRLTPKGKEKGDMGIDIYLNGYDSYKERTKDEETAFDNAVKLRDSQPRESVEANAAQELVDAAYDAMHSGSKGYIRSSYNTEGLKDLRQFGELAKESGEGAFAYISY